MSRRNAIPGKDVRPGRKPLGTNRSQRTLHVVCEGETEGDYLKLLEASFGKTMRFHVIPYTRPEGFKPTGAVERAITVRKGLYRGDRENVWVMFDRDEHPDVGHAAVLARKNQIKVAFSYPSFDLWLWLHFAPGCPTAQGDSSAFVSRVTTPGFMEAVDAIRSGRDRAREPECALRHHLERLSATDPIRARSASEQIDELLRRLDGSWEELAEALRTLVEQTLAPEADILALGLAPHTEGPLYSIMEQVLARELGAADEPGLAVTVARELVVLIREEVRPPHFTQSTYLQKALRVGVRELLIGRCALGRAAATTAAALIVQTVCADIEHFRED